MGFPINPPSAALVDQRGRVTPEWYKFFVAIQRLIGQSETSPFDDSILMAGTFGAGEVATDDLTALVMNSPTEQPQPVYLFSVLEPGTLTAGTGLTGGGNMGANVSLSIDSTVVTLTGSQTLTNKTLTAPAITGFTTGSVLFIGASAVVTEDNANLFWDDSNNRLGIGTSSPQRALHAKSDNASTVTILALDNEDTTANNGTVISFRGATTGGGAASFYEFCALQARYVTHDNATSESRLSFFIRAAGSQVAPLVVESGAVRPNTNDLAALGTATVSWSDLYLASGGVINFNNGNATITHSSGLLTLNVPIVPQQLRRGAPVTKAADFTVAAGENWLINNKSGSACTVTLPSAASNTGREIMISNNQAQTVDSASSNVVPRAGGAAGTAILTAAAGQWATLVSDGTNWIIMAGN